MRLPVRIISKTTNDIITLIELRPGGYLTNKGMNISAGRVFRDYDIIDVANIDGFIRIKKQISRYEKVENINGFRIRKKRCL